MKILSFDTGYNLSWALVDIEKPELIEYGSVCIGEKLSMEDFCRITDKYMLRSDFDYTNIDKILIELPEFYGDVKGTIALKKGDLFYTYASAITVFNSLYTDKKEFITPRQWKGQLSKKATKARIKEILPNFKGNEHETDAVGICLSQNKKLWSLKK